MKKIIGIAGEIGAGKDTFCQYVKENYKDVYVLKFSDALTEVLKIFFDDIKREDQQWISSALRERFGGDVLAKALAKKINSIESGIIILNGVRRPADFEALMQVGGKLAYITADAQKRWERVVLRKEKADDDVPFEKFLELGSAEAEQQISAIGNKADFKIDNNGTKEELYKKIKKIMADKNDEEILVVPSDIIFQQGKWQGLKKENLDYYLEVIKNNCEFRRRGDMENDPSYQQIIPYILFSNNNKFFAYKYLAGAGEQRLVNNDYQLGVGGHINKEDIQKGEDALEQGMMREWEEEVSFAGKLLQKKLVGIINDDSRPVEKVHLGLVYHFEGDSADIQVKETDKMEGRLFELKEISASLSHSPWMQIVYKEYLKGLEKQPGKFFVFEGIDGCGKATQTKLLAEYFKSKGFEVERIDFPQHGQRSCAMVDDYLTGKYGTAKEVGPYVASIFYAADRYDASFKVKKWLAEGKIVISDRYMVSNIGHQGGKIEDRQEWKKYVNWLYDLEYQIFGIPKPDFTFILKTSAEFSQRLIGSITDQEKIETKEKYLAGGKKDIHESDNSHLVNALNSYLAMAEEYPKDFKVVECLEGGHILPAETINQKIIKLIEHGNTFAKPGVV